MCDILISSADLRASLITTRFFFIPDPNLGNYVQKQMPEKEFAFFNGGCPRHLAVTLDDALKAKRVTSTCGTSCPS